MRLRNGVGVAVAPTLDPGLDLQSVSDAEGREGLSLGSRYLLMMCLTLLSPGVESLPVIRLLGRGHLLVQGFGHACAVIVKLDDVDDDAIL